jgi:hypothetical protein
MRIEILDLAKADLLKGFRFYEEKNWASGITSSQIYFQTSKD